MEYKSVASKTQKSKNDEIKYFKDFCKYSLPYLCQKVYEIRMNIIGIDTAMENYHSPTFDKVGTSGSPHQIDIVSLIDRKDMEIEDMKKYILPIRWAIKQVNKIKDPLAHEVVWRLYLRLVSSQYPITTGDIRFGYNRSTHLSEELENQFGISRTKIFKIANEGLQSIVFEDPPY